MSDPKPLYSPEAETCILGIVLVDPERFPEFDIDPAHFYLKRHATIWEAYTTLFAQGRTIDVMTVADQLGMDALAKVGGPAYLTHLITETPLGLDAQEIAAKVKEYSARREAVRVASSLAKASYNTDEPLDTTAFVDRLITLAGIGKGGAVQWGAYLSELYDEIEERARNPKDIWGLPTGFAAFDRTTGGLHNGELMLLSGKPGLGKSIWAMQLAEQASHHIPVAIYSHEMKGTTVARRIVSSESSVNTHKIKSGKFEGDEMLAVIEAIGALSTQPVYMSDETGMTTTELRADLVRLKAQHGIGLFVFDYLLLAGDSPGDDEIGRTAVISRGLKWVCRHVDIPGVAVHSMNKLGMDAGRPDQQNLRGSGQVAYDADLIVFLTEFYHYTAEEKEWPNKENMITLHFAKGRELENPKKYIHMVKRVGFPHFADLAFPV